MVTNSQKKGRNFVSDLVKDPEHPPRTFLAFGWLGDASRKEHTRLYLSANLGFFVDIPNSGILHIQEVDASYGVLGGAYIWVVDDVALSLMPRVA